MPLGLGIVEVLRAIPPRIEVTGHGPTVRITAGSFDAALDYARECYDAPAVLDCELRYRFWPRVTLTVALDPELARSAPPLEELRLRAEEREAALRAARGPAHRADPGSLRADPGVAVEDGPEMAVEDETGLSTLEEIFAHQELRRQERYRIPVQRHGADA